MLFGIVFTVSLHHNPNPFHWTDLADFRGLMLRMLMYKEQYQKYLWSFDAIGSLL